MFEDWCNIHLRLPCLQISTDDTFPLQQPRPLLNGKNGANGLSAPSLVERVQNSELVPALNQLLEGVQGVQGSPRRAKNVTWGHVQVV